MADPSDFKATLPSAHWNVNMLAQWHGPADVMSHIVAAVRMLYNAPFVPVGGVLWNPEQTLPVEERRIITPQEFRSAPALIQVDARLLHQLDQNPERILSLTWRQFESFVASLLQGLGYHVAVSPMGRDGGIDITADRMTPLGAELVLVQCKRFAPSKKVSEPIVKQLCATVDDRKATRGLIVTTSTFTSVALKYIEWKKHKVTGADRGKLQEWMRVIRGGDPG
jgi:restriction system protein